jgi:hypothetical protein
MTLSLWFRLRDSAFLLDENIEVTFLDPDKPLGTIVAQRVFFVTL